MSVQYCLHIFDSKEHPLTMEDLYIESKMLFWPPEQKMFEEYYKIPDLLLDDELVARARAQIEINEIEFGKIETDYLKRWLTEDGKYPGTEWWHDSLDRKWEPWRLAYHRIADTPNFDFGDDYTPSALAVVKLTGFGLIVLDDEMVKAILDIAGDSVDYDSGECVTAPEFLNKYRGHQAFMIAH